MNTLELYLAYLLFTGFMIRFLQVNFLKTFYTCVLYTSLLPNITYGFLIHYFLTRKHSEEHCARPCQKRTSSFFIQNLTEKLESKKQAQRLQTHPMEKTR